MSERLKPCPCCDGGIATHQGGETVHYLSCNNCGWRTHFYQSWDKAYAEWNAHAQPNTCTKDGGQCSLGGYCDQCHSAEPAAAHHWNCPNCPPPGATHTISGQFYRKAEGAWLVFGHKRDWVPSDAPDGWNDANLVPLFPTALAPVVLPERKGQSTRGNGWNACLDELKRLNPTL